ncbi:MAG: SgcJ/EcaC family oxidoreductase [Gemmatimonadaceae bacterium]|nr:SgcJ/EcaC family oxidoreductase [Gemmatimonadaceae bacterium]NUR18180.1 SgcJ/EcaC family oxidoreductase [Gemmatimonadaceae bacterium]
MGDRLTRTLMLAIMLALAGARPAFAQSRRAHADSVRIVAELAGLDSAWHSGDADAWVAHYASDADFVGFVNISGTRMTDRATLRERLARIFAGMFRGSRHVGTLQRLRFLGAHIAVADEDIEITGFAALPAGISATAPGVLRTRMRHVLVRRGRRWLIVASQNTAVAP